ncbi:hypothetical protein GDO81_027671 [Engystomops pustulosus]|uniref:Taste receptor type 2 n=1 Tax=Engystomops pustulosus TaxID=76066 RepID=A0AAV6YE70_ENGPU|nr:hypothetical protein GDO81_027671 [Engystomops pustulosus]
MPLTRWILIIILGILNTVTSFTLNLSILVLGAKSVRTGQRMNPGDLLHRVIAVVTMIIQCLLVSQGLVWSFFTSLLFIRWFYAPSIMGTLTLMYFTYWLTAWLCVYYCVTICNFNHPFFIWSRRNISTHLPHLLLLSAVGCFLFNFPTVWTARVKVTLQFAANSTRGPTIIRGSFKFQPYYLHMSSFMGCFLPFSLNFLSIITTVTSLLRHVFKLRQKDSVLSRAKDRAHLNAIRTMCQFLGISMIFYSNEILFFSKSPDPEDLYTIVGWVIFMFFPTAVPLAIIFSNPKLRKLFTVTFLSFQNKIIDIKT